MKRLLPWLSLGWGVFSVSLITHNAVGIHKFLFFAALFAIAGLSGAWIPTGRRKFFDWLATISQQASAQYILFFAIPLLWKAENWKWLTIATVSGISTLWDPLFNTLWQNRSYRCALITLCLTLLTGLILVTWAPALLHWTGVIVIMNCLVGFVICEIPTWLNSGRTQHRFGFKTLILFWPTGALLLLFFLTSSPIPPLGVWLSKGEIRIYPENQSVECETHIAAPAGFKSEVIHLWEFEEPRLRQEEVVLPEISGNGIDQKPFRTRSRKQTFALPFEQVVQKKIHCSAVIPYSGSVGRVSYTPTP